MSGIWKMFLSKINGLSLHARLRAGVGLFLVLIGLLVMMAFHAARQQAAFREELNTAARAALNIERVNGLIYAVVMESRGIYMSSEPAIVKRYADSLQKSVKELSGVVADWQQMVSDDDADRFALFKDRIEQFIEFRRELVRRAINIGPGAGREWGDNDANRTVRTALNDDLKVLANIYDERTKRAALLGEQNRISGWLLIALGIMAMALAIVSALTIRRSILTPLQDISRATDKIAGGSLTLAVPHIGRSDEIGHLANAVQNFRDAAGRVLELEEHEAAMESAHDQLKDKYFAKKWQLDAAVNNMAQGLIMLDSAGKVMLLNEQYRKMYGLPRETFKAGCTLRDILEHRAQTKLFSGNIDDYLGKIQNRIAKRTPMTTEVELADGRVIRINERAMDGGGWIATHDDCTEQLKTQRRLERTERFLVTVIENMPEAIVAKDGNSLRYIFINRAAETLYGLPRTEIMGKTAHDLFPKQTAELIEQHDRKLVAENREFSPGVHAIQTPGNGTRHVRVRRLPVTGQNGETQVLLSMIEDLTGREEPIAVSASEAPPLATS
jgi:PAS domain S-box-containing protein